MARKYTKVEELAEIVRERHQQGESYREIAGSYKVEEGSGLPKPSENLILAGDKLGCVSKVESMTVSK